MRRSMLTRVRWALFVVLLVAMVGPPGAFAAASEVWVSSEYTTSTQGWGNTRFASVQAAVNSVRPGGTVHIEAGTYTGPVSINKALKMIGQDRPVLDGNGQTVVTIDANGMDAYADSEGYVVTIQGLQVQNGENGLMAGNGDNRIEDVVFKDNQWHVLLGATSDNNLLKGNRMEGRGEGVMVGSDHNVITANHFMGIGPEGPGCTGIRMGASASHNVITDNNLENYRGHIALLGSDSNVIAGNTISDSWDGSFLIDEMRYAGIILWNSGENQILNNTIDSIDGAGIRLFSGSSNNVLDSNCVTNTTREGIGVYFESDNNIVRNHVLSGNGTPLVDDQSSGNTLENNDLQTVSPVTVPEPQGLAESFTVKDEILINRETLWQGEEVTLDSSLVVGPSAVLTIKESTVELGYFDIEVQPGGRLVIEDSTLTGKSCVYVREGGYIQVDDSRFYSLGSWDGDAALVIFGDGAVVRNSVFKGAYVAIQVRQSTGHTITDNEIYNGSQGILIWDPNPNHNIQIKNNRVYNMLASGIAGHALSGSVISGNTLENIHGSAIALGMYDAGWDGLAENFVYYNNLMTGTRVEDFGVNSTWHYGSRGNYWWDFETKSPGAVEGGIAGIWNQVYEVDGNSQVYTVDMFPLIRPNLPSAWAVPEIASARQRNLVTEKVLMGYQERITREEFCELAVKLYESLSGLEAQPVSPNPFVDTTNSEILKANNLGISNGISVDHFAPSAYVTRQEISTMLHRTLAAALPGLDMDASGVGRFADEDDIASWAIEGVRFANKHDIMRGVGEGRIDPLGNTTREQAVALVTRMYGAFSE